MKAVSLSCTALAVAALGLGACFMPDQPSLGATARDDGICRSYGLARETQPYVDCRMRRIDRREVELNEKQRATEWRENLKDRTSRGDAARAEAARIAAVKAQAKAEAKAAKSGASATSQ